MTRQGLGFVLALLVGAAGAIAGEPIKSDGSDIGVTIMGTIIQKQVEDNVALIKESTGAVRAVKKDHVLQDKYKVIAVTAKYIELITRDSQRHYVYQDKFMDQIQAPKAPTALASNSEQFKEDGFERNKGKIAMTAMYRDKLVKEDLAKVLMQATAEPFVENGAIVGFKMSQIDDGSIYQKAGVIDEDIITSINGQELNSVAGAIALLRALKSAEHVDVEVRRNGQPTKISVDIN